MNRSEAHHPHCPSALSSHSGLQGTPATPRGEKSDLHLVWSTQSRKEEDCAHLCVLECWVELHPWWECCDPFPWAPSLSLPGHLYTFLMTYI